jgi:iron(III) transport system permease protein
MVLSYRLFFRWILLVLALLLALPVLTVLYSWAQWNPASASILAEMAHTVLPDYVGTSLLLCLLVSAGVISMGTVSAAAVTLFDFPMRRTLEWALLLPLAMPAYVVAYAYTDYLQFSGPLQTSIRAAFGLEGRVFPEVRNVWGAACVFTLALYPYVYLLARSALSERANHLMEAARLLGAPLSRRILRVALPLARPAIAAGTALAVMETLADFGVSSYFGIQTFTAGIYKAWLVMDNRIAAAQLATLLLVVVVLVLAAEQRAQSRLRFSIARLDRQGADSQALKLHGAGAALVWMLCVLPVLFGFVLPVLFMLRALLQGDGVMNLPWSRFMQWSITSLSLGGMTALMAMPYRAQSLWWACYYLWAGCKRPGRNRAWVIGSPLRCWAWSGLTWCVLWQWLCSRCKAAMRGCLARWMTARGCWEPRALRWYAVCIGPCSKNRLPLPRYWCWSM